MSALNADTAAAWRIIAAKLSEQRPSPGKRVRVTAGKRKGVEGEVRQHILSKYDRGAFRYASDAQATMREMAGRAGYAVLVQRAASPEQFWVSADKVEVIGPLASTGEE